MKASLRIAKLVQEVFEATQEVIVVDEKNLIHIKLRLIILYF